MSTAEIIALISLGLAFFTMIFNGRKDTRVDAAKEARTETKLDSISNGITEIRVDMRTMNKTLTEHSSRIAKVEGSVQESNRRINELEKMFHQAHPLA